MDIWPDCLRNVFCDYTVAIVILISHSINGHLRAYEAVQRLYGYHHVSLSQTRRAIVISSVFALVVTADCKTAVF